MKRAFAYPKLFKHIPVLKGFKLLLLCLCLFPWSDFLDGQTIPPCEDETRIDAYYPCGTIFEPVCACNGKTYRNQCAANYHGGINQASQLNSGPCQEFFFFLYPTMAINGNLVVQYQFQNRGNATLYIIDNFGHIAGRRAIQAGNNFPTILNFDVTTFDAGLYYMLIQSGNHHQIEKFVVAHL